MTLVGIGYRAELTHWIEAEHTAIECIEISTELSDRGGRGRLEVLRDRSPLMIHTHRLSLGTPGPLNRLELAWFADLVQEAQPLWISEHLGFARTEEVNLLSPIPVPYSDDTLSCLVEHALEVVEVCRKPLMMENIASPIRITGLWSEPELLNRFCEQSKCGILLDLTALLVNSRNHGFNPSDWLDELDFRNVVQLHVGGCRLLDGLWEDSHDGPVDQELWPLVNAVLAVGSVQAVILERDARFPPIVELASELRQLKMLCNPVATRQDQAPTR